jgi:hypothetical protein
MNKIKVCFPQGSIEVPHDLPLMDLGLTLALYYLRLRWNVKARRLEVIPIY